MSNMQPGMIVILKPRSPHGHSVINRWGMQWELLKVGRPSCFNEQPGALLQSVRTRPFRNFPDRVDRDLRWIRIENDKDFEVLEDHNGLVS